MNIVIADDSEMIRTRLKKMLNAIPNVSVVAEAENGNDAVDQIRTHRPDLAILDIRMPHKNGIEVTSIVKKEQNLTVFVVTNYYDSHSVIQAKTAGADFVFDKSSEIEDLLKFITLYSEIQSSDIQKN